LAAAGGVLYIPAQVDVNGEEYDAVIRRTAPPGAGEYELSFFSKQGAHYTDFVYLVFRDADHGLGAGPYSSVFYNDGVWQPEKVGAVDFSAVIADPAGGWWGICLDHSGGHRGFWLVYHP
jgi:hypothetical protein